MSTYPLKFGKYLLLERVNVGGMAEVFKAKTAAVSGFDRTIAIKRILPNLVEDDEFVRMFIDEARIAVQLNHPHIVQIYELGKHGEHYYIAMEYLPSRDLRAILDRMRGNGQLMPISQAAYITKRIAEGLDYAHRKKDPSGNPMSIIHRDVSPQNILVGFEGEVKVIDFGIAKAANRASKTQAGVLKGKFGYMSPEQVRGLPTDRRSDVFAVGVLLYEMLTGERLFIGESDFSTLERVRNAEVIPPSTFNKKVTPQLEALCLKVLAREVEDRFQWASEVAEALDPFIVDDKTPYSAKRLAGVMKESYAVEIALERKKQEEFSKITPSGAKAERPKTSIPGLRAEPRPDSRMDPRMDAKQGQASIDDASGDKTFVIEASVAGHLVVDPRKDEAASAASSRRSNAMSPPLGSQTALSETKARTERRNTDEHLQLVSLYGDTSDGIDDSRTVVSLANPFFENPDKPGAQSLPSIPDGIEGLPPALSPGPPPPAAKSKPEPLKSIDDPSDDAPTLAVPATPQKGPETILARSEAKREASLTRSAARRELPLPKIDTKAAMKAVAAAMAEDERRNDQVTRETEAPVLSDPPTEPGEIDPVLAQRDLPALLHAAGLGEESKTQARPREDFDDLPDDASASALPDDFADDLAPRRGFDGDEPAGETIEAMAPPLAAAIPAQTMRLLLIAGAASAVSFFVVLVLFLTRLGGDTGASVELYALGGAALPADIQVLLDDKPVDGFGTPVPITGTHKLVIRGSGMVPVVRTLRAQGASMRMPVPIVSDGTAPLPPQKAGPPDPVKHTDAEPGTGEPQKVADADVVAEREPLTEPEKIVETPAVEKSPVREKPPVKPGETAPVKVATDKPATDKGTTDKGTPPKAGKQQWTLLQVDSRPKAEVFVDKVSKGFAPGLRVRLTVGKHRLELPHEGKKYRYDVTITDDDPANRVVIAIGGPVKGNGAATITAVP